MNSTPLPGCGGSLLKEKNERVILPSELFDSSSTNYDSGSAKAMPVQ